MDIWFRDSTLISTLIHSAMTVGPTAAGLLSVDYRVDVEVKTSTVCSGNLRFEISF